MASPSRKADSINIWGKSVRGAALDDWLLSLVHNTLETLNPQDDVAKENEERWKDVQYQVAAQNLFFLDELHRILKIFNDAGIRVIVLKGAALTEGLYPHLGLRPFGDIDLLIHREELSQVTEILCGLGYSCHSLQFRPGIEDFQGAVNYVKDGKPAISIEPHWTFGPLYPYAVRVDMAGIWARASKAKIAGIDTLVLSPEDLLLHLCLHLFQHRQGNWLTSSCDIAQLVHHYQGRLGWEVFLNRVFDFKLCLPVQYSLQTTFEMFSPPIPPFVLDELSSSNPGRFERQVFASLTSPADKDSRGGAAALAKLLTMPGVARRFRYLWAALLPSRDFVLSYYGITNPKLLLFYYLLHLKNTFLIFFKAFFSFAFPRKNS